MCVPSVPASLAPEGCMSDVKLPPGVSILAEVGGLVDESSVTVCVYGDDLEPTQITERLRCEPTSARRRGERRGPEGPPASTGVWLFNERGIAPTGPEQVIRRALMRLTSDLAVWEALAQQYSLRLNIAAHFSGWNKGFELSGEVVALIAARGLSMGCDLYAYGDEGLYG